MFHNYSITFNFQEKFKALKTGTVFKHTIGGFETPTLMKVSCPELKDTDNNTVCIDDGQLSYTLPDTEVYVIKHMEPVCG